MAKTRLNITVDKDLAAFIKKYAKDNRIAVSDLFSQFILSLQRRQKNKIPEYLIASPDFYHAITDIHQTLETQQQKRNRRRTENITQP